MHEKLLMRINQNDYPILQLSGNEGLAELFYFDVTVAESKDFSGIKLLTPAQIVFVARIVAGVITHIDWQVSQTEIHMFQLRIEPRLALLRLSSAVRLFRDKSVIDIIKFLLKECGYISAQVHWHLARNYENHFMILQTSNESHWQFLQYLCASYGLVFCCGYDADYKDERIDFYDDIISGEPIKTPAFIPANESIVNIVKRASSKVVIKDYDIGTDESINGEFKLRNENFVNSIYGTGAVNNEEAQRQAQIQAAHLQCESCCWLGNTHDCELRPGAVFSLTGKYYLITAINHVTASLANKTVAYHNQIKFISAAQRFCLPLPKVPKMPMLFYARIESESQQPQLNEQGYYRIRFHWDNVNEPNNASPPVPMLSPHGGIVGSDHFATGWHTPLYPGTDVIVGFMSSDLSRPIILGALPNNNMQSPVTSNNASQYRLVTQVGHEILMDDAQNASKIQLHTPQETNKLVFDVSCDINKLILATKEGCVNWQSRKEIRISNNADAEENIIGERQHMAGVNYTVDVRKGDIQEFSDQNYSLVAEKNLDLSANKDVILRGDTIEQHAEKDWYLESFGQLATITVKDGNWSVDAKDDINIIGGGKGDIIIGNSRGNIRITPDSEVYLSGAQIICNVAEEIILRGKVSYKSVTSVG